MSSPAEATSRPDPLQAVVGELFAGSGAQRFGIVQQEFARILEQIARKYLPPASPASEVIAFYRSLRMEELVLARACAAGNETAWQDFLVRYRAKLYQAAGAIAREDSAARELADSLYADLFGAATRDGQRLSKLSYYTGRGSLEGWLRTVLAQEYVNRYRSARRLVSLDEHIEKGYDPPAAPAQPEAPDAPALEAATEAALAELTSEDRFLLAAYYLDNRTLAEIGRMLRLHESSVSRKLEKIVNQLRKKLIENLKRRGMTSRQAQEALEVDVRDLAVNVRGPLAQELAPQSFHNNGAKPAPQITGSEQRSIQIEP